MRNLRKICGVWLLVFTLLLNLAPTGYTANQTSEYTVTAEMTPADGIEAGGTAEISAHVYHESTEITDLAEAGLKLWFWADKWNEHQDGLDSIELETNSGDVLKNRVTFQAAGTYYIVAELKHGDDSLAKEIVKVAVSETKTPDAGPVSPDPVKADIYVPYVAGTEGDFIRGADVSSLLTLLNSGARFSGWDGKSLGDTVDAQGKAFMQLLADGGINWIRLRVWNHPVTADGKGYGGGNNDLSAAATMGKWAADAGLKVLIDFHYSDFWADPGKQTAPKEWKDLNVDEKAAAISKFTTDSLTALLDAGVDVGMVQIGNETNNGISGVWYGSDGWPAACKLFSAGCDAVHAVASGRNKTILTAVHFANPEKEGSYAEFAKNLYDNHVNYDVFASSYYPYWHGTTDNLTAVLKNAADTYGKKVMVAETSWAYTLDDGDGHDNTVREGNNDTDQPYPFTVQGQALEVASVMAAVTAAGENGIGAFYWEPAWIPVNNVSGLTGDNYTAAVDANKKLWEQYGSGWAASSAGEYDAEDAGKWFGGSAVDNQAVFDFDGKPLESLNVFKYVMTGTYGYKVEAIPEALAQEYTVGDTLALPETVTATTVDGGSGVLQITWDAASVRTVNTDRPATHKVTGTASGRIGEDDVSITVTCTVTVNSKNLLSNPGFEEGDTGYTINGAGGRITDSEASNNHAGAYCLHFYHEDAVNFTAEQALKLPAGTYTFTVCAQGGDMGENHTYIYVKFGDTELTEDFSINGWQVWQTPKITFTLTGETEVTVGASVTAGSGAWGSLDDWHLGAAYSEADSSAETNLPFTDVSTSSWYYTDVVSAYKSGLISGKTAARYAPDENMSIAEAIKLAACIYQLAEEKAVSLTNSTTGTWYNTYVEYARDAGIISGDYDDYTATISRALYADLFSRALPADQYTVMNEIADNAIPDVPMDAPYAEAIYKMYRAGILMGSEHGAFRPDSPITRSEVAAVLTRMIDSTARVSCTL